MGDKPKNSCAENGAGEQHPFSIHVVSPRGSDYIPAQTIPYSAWTICWSLEPQIDTAHATSYVVALESILRRGTSSGFFILGVIDGQANALTPIQYLVPNHFQIRDAQNIRQVQS